MNPTGYRPPTRLEPPSREVLAAHRRTNRILLALAVMIVSPILVVSLGTLLANRQVSAWGMTPTFRFNEVVEVTVSSPGKYVVWSSVQGPDCRLSFAGEDLHLYPHVDPAAPLEPVGSFDLDRAGTITIECVHEDEDAFGKIAGKTPTVSVLLFKLGSWGLAFTLVVIGITMLAVGVAKNRDEKRTTF